MIYETANKKDDQIIQHPPLSEKKKRLSFWDNLGIYFFVFLAADFVAFFFGEAAFLEVALFFDAADDFFFATIVCFKFLLPFIQVV